MCVMPDPYLDVPTGSDTLDLGYSRQPFCYKCCCCCLCPKFQVNFPADLVCIGKTPDGTYPEGPCGPFTPPPVTCTGEIGFASSPAFSEIVCLVDTDPGSPFFNYCTFGPCDEDGLNCGESQCHYIGTTVGCDAGAPYGTTYHWYTQGALVVANPLSQPPQSCFQIGVNILAVQVDEGCTLDPTDCASIFDPLNAACVAAAGDRNVVLFPIWDECNKDAEGYNPVPSDTTTITSIVCIDDEPCLPEELGLQVMLASRESPQLPPKSCITSATKRRQKMPSLLTQAKNLAKSVTKHVRHGLPMVDDEEKQRRLDICGSCEFYTGTRCTKCGCRMKHKAAWALEKCPVGKW